MRTRELLSFLKNLQVRLKHRELNGTPGGFSRNSVGNGSADHDDQNGDQKLEGGLAQGHMLGAWLIVTQTGEV
jgi:hypothetical protein